ncbi:MAG TPA: polysaccharide biosynthesis/export family protein [Thermoguttaceae bacterium]|nr:polysaccharide biosynthesis/export family protein [Thermoguttaceae bacterium]
MRADRLWKDSSRHGPPSQAKDAATRAEKRRLGEDLDPHRRASRLPRLAVAAAVLFGLSVTVGCWAPLCSPGVPACALPDEFRLPMRTAGPPLNFASLALPPQKDYILGPDDVLEVIVHDLYPGGGGVQPIRAQIMANGTVQLPLVGPVGVGGMNVMQAHVTINRAYADGFIRDPRINVYLAERSLTSVLVLGEVGAPGMYRLPKYENDVAHALAVAGGLREDAGLEIEVHRRITPDQVRAARYEHPIVGPPNLVGGSVELAGLIAQPDGVIAMVPPADPGARPVYPVGGPGQPAVASEPLTSPLGMLIGQEPMEIVRIPLRGYPSRPIFTEDVVLNPGDVVVVPSRKDEVFYVVGPLSPTNFVRFSISARERDIGAGFLLPRDREIDVVTAVAMAGYIDPINSPTTVTVQRHLRDGRSMRILVDLLKARYDPKETVLVSAGDIIYLNPDSSWWFRRTFDRIIVDLFRISYRKALGFGD